MSKEKTRTLIVGAVIGAIFGAVFSFLLASHKTEENQRQLNAKDVGTLALSSLGVFKQIIDALG